MKGKKKIMKQWNHQGRELSQKKKRPARIIAANKLELQKKGTEQYKTMDSAKN